MVIALKEKGGVYKLPDEFTGYTVLMILKANHIAPNRGSYYGPPLCGADTSDHTFVSRRRQWDQPELHVCRICAEAVLG